MKIFNLFLSLVIALLLLGCEGSDSSGNSESIYIPTENRSVTLESGVLNNSLEFFAYSDWSISLSDTKASTDWIDVSPMSGGAGNVTLNVDAEINTTTEDRSAILSINTDDGSQDIMISQDAAIEVAYEDSFIEITPSGVDNISSDGGAFAILLPTNAEFSIESTQEWLSIDEDDNVIIISVSSNESLKGRKGHIIITTDSTTSVLSVTQNSISGSSDLSTLQITPSETQSITYDGGDISINVISDLDWSVASSQDWAITNSGNTKVTVDVLNNDLSIPRQVAIIFAAENHSEVLLVEQGYSIGDGDDNEIFLNVTGFSDRIVSAAGEVFDVIIESNTSWLIDSDDSWVKIPNSWGHDDDESTITIEPNTSGEERESIITIKTRYTSSSEEISYEMKITQKGATISVSPTLIEVPFKGGVYDIDISVDTDAKWGISTAENDYGIWYDGDVNWITISGAELKTGSDTITINVASSEDYISYFVARSAQLKFYLLGDPTQTVDVEIWQELPEDASINFVEYTDLWAGSVTFTAEITDFNDRSSDYYDFYGFYVSEVTEMGEKYIYTIIEDDDIQLGKYTMEITDLNPETYYYAQACVGKYLDGNRTVNNAQICCSDNVLYFDTPDAMVGQWRVVMNGEVYDNREYDINLYESGSTSYGWYSSCAGETIEDKRPIYWDRDSYTLSDFSMTCEDFQYLSGTINRSYSMVIGSGKMRVDRTTSTGAYAGSYYYEDVTFAMTRLDPAPNLVGSVTKAETKTVIVKPDSYKSSVRTFNLSSVLASEVMSVCVEE